jgi:hypothetical protein
MNLKTKTNRKSTRRARIFVEHPDPGHLYDLAEVASYVGRTTQLLRVYYGQKLLPEPKHSIKGIKKTTRKFTLDEMKMLKSFFARIGYGSISKARTYKKRREELAEIISEKHPGTNR